MNSEVVSFLAALVESLGEEAENAGVWDSVAPWLKQFGLTVGLSASVMDAIDQSSNLADFYARLRVDIAGGDVGAAVAITIASGMLDLAITGVGLISPDAAVALTASIAGLPTAVTVTAVAIVAALGVAGGSSKAGELYTAAYSDLVQAFENLTAPAPSSWTEIGTDSSGNSLLLDAVFNNALGAALGLGNDSTMLVDIASSATGTSSSPLYNGDIAASSLQADANFLGSLVANGEIGGPAPTDGTVNPLAGTAATQALCDIAVQYAGDQAATAANGPGFLLDPNPYGDFSASTSSVLNIDLNPANWSTTYAQANPSIVGEQELLDAVSNNLLPAGSSTAWVDNYLAQNHPSLIEAALAPGAVLSDAGAAVSYNSATANAVLIGQSDSTINAGDGNDLIVGGQNVTAGNGNNIIVGAADGHATITVGSGSNLIYEGGTGNLINIDTPGASPYAPLPNPGLNFVFAGNGDDTVNINCGDGTAGVLIQPVANLTEANLLNLDTSALATEIDSYFSNWSASATGSGEISPLTGLTAPANQLYEPTYYDTSGLTGFDWTVILVPTGTAYSNTDTLESDGGAGSVQYTPGKDNQGLIPYIAYQSWPFTFDDPSGEVYTFSEQYGIVDLYPDSAPTPPLVDLADYQQTDLNPPLPPAPPSPPQQPSDPGPVAGSVSETIDVGQSMDLTSAILAAATPGLAGDVLSITSVNVSGTIGSVSFNNGEVTYTASAGAFSGLAANASEADAFSYTLCDQLGDVASGEVDLAIDNPVASISGPQYGGGTIEGVDGPEIISASGWNNVIDANGGGGTINAGQGSATVNAGAGNLTINLDGYSNAVTGGDGDDVVSGSQGNASIALGNGNDSVTTGGYNNIIGLGNGNDSVNAGQGNDTITLGNGNNVITAGGYDNSISVGNGNNVIAAGAGNETLVAGSGENEITAQGYDNSITLGSGSNNVSAGAGSDVVTANGGDDILAFSGWSDVIKLLNGANTAISDNVGGSGGGLQVDIGSANSVVSIAGYDPNIWIDLLTPDLGYSSTSQVTNALTSDGHGGTLLALAGSAGSVDFMNMNPTQLHASNFGVG